MSARTPYKGSCRKLVLAFDVGTTFSGISYSVLDPGQIPVIKGVTRFPAHEKTGGSSKIPTIIYYDKKGAVQAVGAEATCDGIGVAAEDGNWSKAEWFKLHLRSKAAGGQNITEKIPPLPPNKTVVQVFADFLQYLLHCASRYIQDSHANGTTLWDSVKSDIIFVLSHPNGWEGKEQSQMRRAAVLAGLIPDDPSGQSRVSFVTEGEASLHFAIQNGVLSGAMAKGEGIIIVDAGGGTIDISTYRRVLGDTNDKAFEEIAAPQCTAFFFVNIYAEKFLTSFLEDTAFVEDVGHIVQCFDKATKPRYKNADEPQYIKFGSTRDNDPAHNIRFGQLKLAGSDVAEFFTPSVTSVIKAVLEQKSMSHNAISHVVMVGGFAASDWLFDNVAKALKGALSRLNVVRPEEHANKAVSDGAVSFFLDHFVRTRVSKVAYGQEFRHAYNPFHAEHRKRSAKTYITPSGQSCLNGIFHVVLPKNTQVSEEKEFRHSCYQESPDLPHLKTATPQVMCYRGSNVSSPLWMDVETDQYTKLCTVAVDLSSLPKTVHTSSSGKPYYRVCYDLVILFGLTEMRAQVAWKENGVEKRSPATIIYEEDDV